MKKTVAILPILITIVLLSCSENEFNPIAGTWENYEVTTYQDSETVFTVTGQYTFNSKGRGNYYFKQTYNGNTTSEGEKGISYKTNVDKLTVNFDEGFSYEVNYFILGNELSFIFDDGDTIVYTKL